MTETLRHKCFFESGDIMQKLVKGVKVIQFEQYPLKAALQ